MNSRRFIITIALAVLAITGITTWQSFSSADPVALFEADQTVEEITVNELVKGEINPVLFIDVRTLPEYQRDHIGDSPLIPVTAIEADQATEMIQQVIQAHQQTLHTNPIVVLYCTRGIRSARAQRVLAADGIPTLSLAGGITAWRSRVSPEQEPVVLQQLTTSTQPG